MKEIGITSSSTQLGINGGMKSCSLVTNIGMSFLADKMGRRPMYLISVSTDITGREVHMAFQPLCSRLPALPVT
jgi:hypothetical protein